jgi:hypothetical protein
MMYGSECSPGGEAGANWVVSGCEEEVVQERVESARETTGDRAAFSR